MSNVAAIIVTYNPDKEKLIRNIDSLIGQVEKIAIIDNGSNTTTFLQNLCSKAKYAKCLDLVLNKKNYGIAMALNIGFNHLKNEYDWILTMDQDSEISRNFISSATEFMHSDTIGIITTNVRDNNINGNYENDNSQRSIFVDRCITSGSLTNVEAWKRVGGFDGRMFIDLVDFDFCYRVKEEKYKIIRNNSSYIKHEVGKITMHGFGKKHIVYNHPPIRKYYFARNYIYITRKNRNLHWRTAAYRILEQFINVIFYENSKQNKLKSLSRGVLDGFLMEIDK